MGGPLGARWQIAGDPLSAFPRRKHPRTNHQELRYALMRNERGRAECRSCMIPASGDGSQVRNGANFRDDPQPRGDLAVLVGGRLGKRPSAQRYGPFRVSICAGSGEIREPDRRTGNNGPAAGSVLWRSARCEGSPARRDNTQGKRTMLIRTRAQPPRRSSTSRGRSGRCGLRNGSSGRSSPPFPTTTWRWSSRHPGTRRTASRSDTGLAAPTCT